jgi:hypothetical protein
MYKIKYLKYKTKYLNLKYNINQSGGNQEMKISELITQLQNIPEKHKVCKNTIFASCKTKLDEGTNIIEKYTDKYIKDLTDTELKSILNTLKGHYATVGCFNCVTVWENLLFTNLHKHNANFNTIFYRANGMYFTPTQTLQTLESSPTQTLQTLEPSNIIKYICSFKIKECVKLCISQILECINTNIKSYTIHKASDIKFNLMSDTVIKYSGEIPKIASGSNGDIYKIQPTSLPQCKLVAKINITDVDDSEKNQIFKETIISMILQCKSENIFTICVPYTYDILKLPGSKYIIITELLSDGDLYKYITTSNTNEYYQKNIISLFLQIFCILKYYQEKFGFCHRDFKSDNIMIRSINSPKVSQYINRENNKKYINFGSYKIQVFDYIIIIIDFGLSCLQFSTSEEIQTFNYIKNACSFKMTQLDLCNLFLEITRYSNIVNSFLNDFLNKYLMNINNNVMETVSIVNSKSKNIYNYEFLQDASLHLLNIVRSDIIFTPDNVLYYYSTISTEYAEYIAKNT